MPTGLGDEQLWLSATNDNTGTSTAFQDQSGQGNNGTAAGTLVVADTSEGGSYAFDFDGVNDYISNSSLDLRNLTAMSWSAWVKDTKATSTISAMFSFGKNGTSSYPDDILFFQTSWSLFQINSGADGNGQAAGSKNQWQHVAIVFDGSGTGNSGRMLYFLNGVAVAMTYNYTVPASTSAITPYETRIGSYTGAPNGNYFQGLQDDIRVFERALTQAEITHLAEARGIEGTPPVGLGDEKLWLCPSLNDSAADISGNGNDGTYQGGMGTIADTSNGGSRCYDFDGTNDYIDISGFAANTSAYSVSCWIDGTGPNQTIVAFNSGDSSGGRAINIGLQPSGTALAGHQNGGSSYWAESTSSVNGSGWKHIACTFDGSTVEIFIDGVSEDTQAASVTDKTQALAYIGRWVGTTPFWLTGKMDDIRAYDRALTQAEITHLATSRGIEGSPSGPATQYNAFITHAFKQLFQARLR